MLALAKNASEAAKELMKISAETRRKILDELASVIEREKEKIIAANKIDLENAKRNGVGTALIDRLKLDELRVLAMVSGVKEIACQEEVVGKFYQEFANDKGLVIKRQRIPLGVILMIFESRPNVVIDCAALAIKSSNAIILKGGKEAKESNEILGSIVQKAISKFIPKDSVQVIASDDRSQVEELLTFDRYIDVVIPRGGEKLIEYVYNNSKVPVIAHFQGLCHTYVDRDADPEKALKIIVNAKTQRTGVCNAMETLIVHEEIAKEIGSEIVKALNDKKTELVADELFNKLSGENLPIATEKDWKTEYLDNKLSIKTVKSLNEAIAHISQYGSRHTEAIISEDEEACEEFLRSVDASCIVLNASTRFNDGGQLGLGAEIGISTTKFHAYGPMGAEQMTTSRFVVVGNGHCRDG